LTKVDQKGSLGVVGEVFEVMAEVDRRLTKVNTVDRFIRVNKPDWKPGASQYAYGMRFFMCANYAHDPIQPFNHNLRGKVKTYYISQLFICHL
jgi:hypothetical protein